jgi:dihydrofolate reductase
MVAQLPTATDRQSVAAILNPARKVVFSRTMKTADWANTTIAAGDTAEEIDRLRLGGDGHVVVWGGVSLWRSLMRLDLIDEFHLDLFPYVAGKGTRLFEDVPKSYQLDLISGTALEQRDRRAALPAAPLNRGGCAPSPDRWCL